MRALDGRTLRPLHSAQGRRCRDFSIALANALIIGAKARAAASMSDADPAGMTASQRAADVPPAPKLIMPHLCVRRERGCGDAAEIRDPLARSRSPLFPSGTREPETFSSLRPESRRSRRDWALADRPCLFRRTVTPTACAGGRACVSLWRVGFRLLRGAARLILAGFVAIGCLSQPVWTTSFRETEIKRDF